MATENIYVDGDSNLIFPGDPEHELLDATHSPSQSQQRKVLELMRRVIAGEFDIAQTKDWTTEQKREFMESLPEAVV